MMETPKIKMDKSLNVQELVLLVHLMVFVPNVNPVILLEMGSVLYVRVDAKLVVHRI